MDPGGIDDLLNWKIVRGFKNNLYKLWNRMSSGSYFPKKAVRVVETPKDSGGTRTGQQLLRGWVIVSSRDDDGTAYGTSFFHNNSIWL